jgi:transketolase
VGPLGKVVGMGRFGASAPYAVLDEKFGFTARAAARQAERYLADFKITKRKLRASLSR